MLSLFQKHLDFNFPFLKDKKLLIAISGGIDSVVLTHLMHQLNLNFSLCHCNFQLRGEESDGDENFVKQLGKEMGRTFHSTKFDTESYANENKLSTQVAARELRYQWFHELLDTYQYDYVLTAHNTNDNLETFLINLTRGSGLDGFTGIPTVNQKIVRPLLEFSRNDIMMFAIKNGITWREDHSNATVKYVRNKIRHKIVPTLEEINPHILDTFRKTLEHLNQSQEIIRDRIEEVSKETLTTEENRILIDIRKIDTLQNKKAYLYQMLHPYGFTEWDDVFHLLSAQSGKQVFSKTHRLLKDRSSLVLIPIQDSSSSESSFSIHEEVSKISTPIALEFQEYQPKNVHDKNTILVDKGLLHYPLSLRKWKHGDVFSPTGMKGVKKVAKLFKDKKLSLIEKEQIWLLTDARDQIVWIVGIRQDRRFLVSDTTTEKIQISLKTKYVAPSVK